MLPACAQKGVRGWWGTQMEGGDVQPGWRGLPANGRGGAPSLVPPRHACKGGGRARSGSRGSRGEGGGWGEGGGGGGRAGRRGRLVNGKGGGTLCPPCPQHACKGGGGRAAGV